MYLSKMIYVNNYVTWVTYISMSERNTIVSGYTLYKHLQ